MAVSTTFRDRALTIVTLLALLTALLPASGLLTSVAHAADGACAGDANQTGVIRIQLEFEGTTNGSIGDGDAVLDSDVDPCTEAGGNDIRFDGYDTLIHISCSESLIGLEFDGLGTVTDFNLRSLNNGGNTAGSCSSEFLPTGSIADECREEDGAVTGTVDNTGSTATTATLSIYDGDSSPVDSEDVDVPAGAASTSVEITGLPDGTYTAELVSQGTLIASRQITVDCDEDLTFDDPTGEISSACVEFDGSITADVDTTGAEGTTATLTVKDQDGNVVDSDTAVISSDSSATLTVDGLDDGTYDVELTAGDTVLDSEDDLVVECDEDLTFDDPTGEISSACVEFDGSITADVDTTGAEGTTATLTVKDQDGNVVDSDTAVISSDSSATLTVDGLDDGTYDVELTAGDTVLDSEDDLVVECDEQVQEPTPSIDVVKDNDADDDGAFSDFETAPEPGADVDFQVVVTNDGEVDGAVRIFDALDDGTTLFLFGLDDTDTTDVATTCVDGDGAAFVETDILAVGESITCTFTLAGYAGEALDDRINTVTAELVRYVLGEDEQTVTAVEVLADDEDPSIVTTDEVLGETEEPEEPTEKPEEPEEPVEIDDDEVLGVTEESETVALTGSDTTTTAAIAFAMLALGLLALRRDRRWDA